MTGSLKRLAITVAQSCAEGMMVSDPVLYACYVRCKADIDEEAAPRVTPDQGSSDWPVRARRASATL
jgi:hypothetical protein